MENAPATTNDLPSSPLAVMQNNVSRQPILKQMGFLLAIAASIALGGYVLMWSQSPSYQILFSGIEAKESAEVVGVLQQMNVDYKLDPTTGAILVPASKIQKLRLRLASEGLPRSSSQGMAMLNKDQSFGTSQFIERARYQQALEEELARSITELQNVRAVRVHLAIPKRSVFIRDRKPPTASVVVSLYAGRILERGQVEAITHMVASSVSDMSSGDVTVVDQKGTLLTESGRDDGTALSDSQLEYTQKIERQYIRRIEDILTPIVGLGGVRAQVVADVDFTRTEQTHENYNPDTAALRSEQLQEDRRVGGGMAGAMGVPGALSNQPPAGGALKQAKGNTTKAGSTEADTTTPESSSKRTTRNFELDRTISHQRMAPGAVKKLSVAVLVDERHAANDKGGTVSTPLTKAEMTRINALVTDAIGFNKARGDSLNIVNAPFVAPAPAEPLPELAIWKQPWVWSIAKQVLAGIVVLFILFGMIRPAFRDLNKVPAGANKRDGLGSAAEGQQGAGGIGAANLTAGSENMESQLNNVRSLVQQDPAIVAQVVKNWTASDA